MMAEGYKNAIFDGFDGFYFRGGIQTVLRTVCVTKSILYFRAINQYKQIQPSSTQSFFHKCPERTLCPTQPSSNSARSSINSAFCSLNSAFAQLSHFSTQPFWKSARGGLGMKGLGGLAAIRATGPITGLWPSVAHSGILRCKANSGGRRVWLISKSHNPFVQIPQPKKSETHNPKKTNTQHPPNPFIRSLLAFYGY